MTTLAHPRAYRADFLSPGNESWSWAYTPAAPTPRIRLNWWRVAGLGIAFFGSMAGWAAIAFFAWAVVHVAREALS